MDEYNKLYTYSLNADAARNLTNSTKSTPMMEGITPRWLLSFLPWVGVEAGIYKVNKRKNYNLYPHSAQYESDKEKHLFKIPPFRFMNPEYAETITPYLKKSDYDQGTSILTDETEGDKFIFVTQGKVEVTTKNPHGKAIKVGLLSAGDFSDIYAFLDQSERAITVTALTPCSLYLIDRSDLDEWLSQSDEIQENYDEAMRKWLIEGSDTNEDGEKSIHLYSGRIGEYDIPTTYPDYEVCPKEYPLNVVQTILKMNTQVTDIFNSPINQFDEQMRLTVEAIKERQEYEIINNKEFGLLNQVAPKMRITCRTGVPTPDDMDELLSKVWKKPAFFLAHPRAIAAFGRECTKRGVPPVAINLMGSPFITWRGVPLIPCDKLLINGKKQHHSCGTSNILLMRVGEKEQGVIGLHQPGIPNEKYMPSLSVKHCGINDAGMASYILRLYYSTAVLADDAIGVLQDVEVGQYNE